MNLTVGDDLALAFVLLFARCSGLMVALPAALGVAIPVRVRVLLSALLAGSLMPLAKLARPSAGGPLPIGLMMTRELAVGTTLALAAAVVIGAVLTAGDVVGTSMELHGGSILRGSTLLPNVLGDGLGGLAGMLFFIAGFHRTVLLGLGRSLRMAPLGVVTLPGVHEALAMGSQVFMLALELALPLLIPLFMLSVAQGVLARLAPQVNMLLVAPAAIVFAGLVLLLMDSHGMVIGMVRAWESMIDQALSWTNG